MKIKKIISTLLFSLLMVSCAMQEFKKDALVLEKEADIAYKAKRWKDAEQKYTELIVLSPNSAEVWFRLGNIYAHQKDPDKAIAAYREAVIRQPSYKKAWHNFGVMSLRQTTSVYLEMLTHLPHDSEQYKQAKEMAEDLVGLIEKQRKYNVSKQAEPVASK